jgi:hypothetical protein
MRHQAALRRAWEAQKTLAQCLPEPLRAARFHAPSFVPHGVILCMGFLAHGLSNFDNNPTTILIVLTTTLKS